MVCPAFLFCWRRSFFSLAILCAGILLATVTAPTAYAQTIVFNNGGPDLVNGFPSDSSYGQFSADTFTFSSATPFNSVQWFGAYDPTNTPLATDNFTISFYNTTNGIPDTTAFATFTVGNAVNRTAIGTTQFGDTAYAYSSVLTGGLSLTAGTYGISIANDLTPDQDDIWLWLTSNQTGTNYFRNDDTSPFTASTSGDLAFRLTNDGSGAAIPEPGSLALVGMATIPLVGTVLRRRKTG